MIHDELEDKPSRQFTSIYLIYLSASPGLTGIGSHEAPEVCLLVVVRTAC